MMRLGLSKLVSKFFGSSYSAPGIWGWASPGNWSKKDLIEQYKNYVYPIVSAIAEEAAKVDFIIEKPGGKVPLNIPNHDFLKLMKKPNPDASQMQFLELHFTFMELAGESFWYIGKGQYSGKPKELYLLRPDMMDVAVDTSDPRGLVAGYVMTKPDGTKVPMEKEEVLHFKMPNPKNPYRGLGTVEAAKIYIETENYSADFTKNSIFNSGRASGIVNLKGTINKDEFDTFKRQFKNEYSGTKNAGKTLLFRGAEGIDYTKLGMELGETALKELKDMNKADLMMMWRVSKTMLGISEDVNRANAKESKEVFRENVITAKLDRFTDHISAFFIAVYWSDVNLRYRSLISKSDNDRVTEWTAGHNKWLTTNSIIRERNAAFGSEVPEQPGGDVIYQSIAIVPMGEDPANPTPTGGKKLKKKSSE